MRKGLGGAYPSPPAHREQSDPPTRTTVTTHTLDSLQPGPVAISRHNILYAVHTGPQDVGGAVLGVVPCTLIRVVLQAGTVPPRIRGPVVLVKPDVRCHGIQGVGCGLYHVARVFRMAYMCIL